MAEEKPTVASSVEAGGIKTSTQSEVIDVTGGAGDAVQSTEDKFPTGELNNFILSETMTTTEGAKPTEENSSSSAEETVTSTGETREGDISAADTISNIKDTSSSTEQVTASAHQTSSPAQAALPCIEEVSSLTETIPCIEEISHPTVKINANAQETYSPPQSTIPCIEENSSSTETVIASVQETSSPAQVTILCTEETSPPREENIPVAETIPCIGKTISPTEQVILTTQEINCPTEDINSCTEETCILPEVALQETSADATMLFEMKTIEQAVTLTVNAEKMNQTIDDMDSATEGAIQSTTGTIIPTVMTIQNVNPESEVVTSCQLIEEELENSLVENSADGENGEAVPAGEGVIPLPTEEVYKENGKADTNVKDCNSDDNGDDTGADEEIYSEEFQQGNDSSDSPSTSSILSSQPESPTNTDSAEDRLGASRRPDIAKHSYSRYNTVSYRKIRKGNTKQRIDEFESMVHIN
ncbi:hypothetical protein scyTo_0011706 [Scyliorhinus torazame]|uniref:Ermin n=1 Tax=Scyliorhinus torazame TaxID=75743 RepID=A0A401NT98_SCYTO|nr:hypothetical protein [Scyliorhinus torazame]